VQWVSQELSLCKAEMMESEEREDQKKIELQRERARGARSHGKTKEKRGKSEKTEKKEKKSKKDMAPEELAERKLKKAARRARRKP
jgi:hypothetical protein